MRQPLMARATLLESCLPGRNFGLFTEQPGSTIPSPDTATQESLTCQLTTATIIYCPFIELRPSPSQFCPLSRARLRGAMYTAIEKQHGLASSGCVRPQLCWVDDTATGSSQSGGFSCHQRHPEEELLIDAIFWRVMQAGKLFRQAGKLDGLADAKHRKGSSFSPANVPGRCRSQNPEPQLWCRDRGYSCLSASDHTATVHPWLLGWCESLCTPTTHRSSGQSPGWSGVTHARRLNRNVRMLKCRLGKASAAQRIHTCHFRILWTDATGAEIICTALDKQRRLYLQPTSSTTNTPSHPKYIQYSSKWSTPFSSTIYNAPRLAKLDSASPLDENKVFVSHDEPRPALSNHAGSQ